jgi:glycosyltransferase involved in cell wall biosynthesis
MKIGILGNMNNSYFSLARYLRDAGFDCDVLIYCNEDSHFDPSCDSYSTAYKAYCKKLSWGDPADFLRQDFSIVRNDLEPYDFIIGNGPAPAYLLRIGRRLDIFMPYGYDLYSLSAFKLVHPKRMRAYWTLRSFQREGIRKSDHILFDKANAEFEKIFEDLGVIGSRIVAPHPVLYYKEYESRRPVLADWFQQLLEIRANTDLIFVQHGRQIWKKSVDKWSYKANDYLIKGYAKFLSGNPEKSSKLFLFEYGSDVDESKKLIAQLGIDSYVQWVPKAPRTEFMEVIGLADLVVGELHHSWCTYGVILEALYLGKPIMHKRHDADYVDVYPELYPNFYADSVASVCEGLKLISSAVTDLPGIGAKGKEWFLKYCVDFPIDIITTLINEKAAGRA